ncbi:MAG: Hsp20/alpha crystallin family protein [Bacteroidetes bacterium]|nr:Hsp20/alpha crystallin family protein [Bacteroidota bacterium]MBU1113617.1 Hsp20/alpha crystallin family protein [Bacteroidota bacterium]MBU1797755.1 Hsp20/alpha crystallin family protein [Bacteroidota bacterium]
MTDEKNIVKVVENNNWEEALENETWVAPKTNIFETDDNYFLTADMPGVSRDNIKVELEKGSLIIMGKIDYQNVSTRKYILRENEFGNFYRKFNLSDSIDSNKIDAKYENGQLVVTLPKHERVKPKNIVIN